MGTPYPGDQDITNNCAGCKILHIFDLARYFTNTGHVNGCSYDCVNEYVYESWSSLLVRNKSKYFRASRKQWEENKRLLAEETCPLSCITSWIMSPPQEPPCCAMVLCQFAMTFNRRDNYLPLCANHDKSLILTSVSFHTNNQLRSILK